VHVYLENNNLEPIQTSLDTAATKTTAPVVGLNTAPADQHMLQETIVPKVIIPTETVVNENIVLAVNEKITSGNRL
jgi:hypothetical protein